MSRIAVVVPTVPGREQLLAKVVTAYLATWGHKVQLLVQRGHTACGAAWLAGAAQAQPFDYLHLGADDLVPWPGWADRAIEAVEAGHIPVPLVWLPDGTLQSAGIQGMDVYTGPYADWQAQEHTTVPFMSAQQWARIGMVPLHYCTDLWVSAMGARRGWLPVIRTGYQFTHYNAAPGRGDQHGRTIADRHAYLQLLQERT